jgi:hypothetical protein
MSDTGSKGVSAGQSGIVPLFATPFAAVNTGVNREFNDRVVRLCESQQTASSVPGRDDFFALTDPLAGELRRLILNCASGVVAGLGSAADFARLQIQARGWCSVVSRNAHVSAQHFPGASWLAVFCAQAGEPDAGISSAGVLRLYERRLGSVYRDASISELKSPFRYGNHTWTPVPGYMALFPAHLPHEVSVVRSDTPLVLVFAMIRFIDINAKDGGHG